MRVFVASFNFVDDLVKVFGNMKKNYVFRRRPCQRLTFLFVICCNDMSLLLLIMCCYVCCFIYGNLNFSSFFMHGKHA
jgi:hypothetical protein